MTSKIKALISDFDGVFVDTFHVIYGAYNYMCERMGFPLFKTMEDFKKFYTVDFGKNYDSFGLSGDERKKAYDYVQTYVKLAYPHALFFEEAVKAVVKLKQKLGIASTGDAAIINNKIKGNILERKVSTIVGHESVKNIKPHPEPVLLCAERLGVPVGNCAFMGDTRIDIIAGKAANVAKTIGVSWGYDGAEELAKERPDMILFRDDEEIREIANEHPYISWVRLSDLEFML